MERGLWVKTAVLLVFFLWLVKSLKNFQTITLLINSRKVNFCLFSSTVLYLLDELHIFSMLHLTKLVGILRSGATRAVALDMSRTLDRVWHAGLLHRHRSYGISGQVYGLILSFFSNIRIRVVLDGKSLQEYFFPQGSFLVLHFSYYSLVICLVMLSLILLSMLMILLSTLSVISYLVCGNN